MKKLLPLATCLIACSLLVNVGCSKEEPTAVVQADTPNPPSTSVTPAVAPTVVKVDPFVEMKEVIDHSTYAKHDSLSEVEARMDRAVEDQVAQWKTAGHDVKLSSDEKLRTATQDFTEKLRSMSLATEEGWETVKHNVKASLDTLRSAYIECTTVPVQK